jgi:hypothetical protein
MDILYYKIVDCMKNLYLIQQKSLKKAIWIIKDVIFGSYRNILFEKEF